MLISGCSRRYWRGVGALLSENQLCGVPEMGIYNPEDDVLKYAYFGIFIGRAQYRQRPEGSLHRHLARIY